MEEQRLLEKVAAILNVKITTVKYHIPLKEIIAKLVDHIEEQKETKHPFPVINGVYEITKLLQETRENG